MINNKSTSAPSNFLSLVMPGKKMVRCNMILFYTPANECQHYFVAVQQKFVPCPIIDWTERQNRCYPQRKTF